MLDKVKTEKFINSAMKYKGDRYSQSKRLQKGYSDCSSIIQKALNDIGLNTNPSLIVTTYRIGIVGDSRFKEIPIKDIQRGDILWWHKTVSEKYEGHVGIYLGDNKVLEAIKSGVNIYPKSRLAWQKAYRIMSLEKTNKPVEGIPIFINGKEIKKGYMLNDTTYISIGGTDKPVRKVFESIGATVKWENNQIKISI